MSADSIHSTLEFWCNKLFAVTIIYSHCLSDWLYFTFPYRIKWCRVIVSAGCLYLQYSDLTSIIHSSKESASEWIAVLANLVFLSLLSVALKQQLSSQELSLLENLHLSKKEH